MVISLGQPHLDLFVERALADLHRRTQLARDGLGQPGGLVALGSLGHHAVDQPDLLGLRGVDHHPGGQHFEGLLARHHPAERDHRGRAEQPDIHAIHAKPRDFRRNREVAACDQLAAGGGGDGMNLGDHRLRQADDLLHHRGAAAEEVGEVAAAVVVGLPPGLHLLQIMARAERLARTAQDHHLDVRLALQPGQRLGQRRQQGIRQRIERLGAIEGQDRDRAIIFAQQDRFGHGFTPPVWRNSSAATGQGEGDGACDGRGRADRVSGAGVLRRWPGISSWRTCGATTRASGGRTGPCAPVTRCRSRRSLRWPMLRWIWRCWRGPVRSRRAELYLVACLNLPSISAPFSITSVS